MSPELKPRHFYDTGLESVLDSIVLDKESAGQDFLERATGDKRHSLKATIKALFNEILGREKLSRLLAEKIEEEIMQTHTYLQELRQLTRYDYSGFWMLNLNSRRTQLEDRAIKLEQEIRQESVGCWRDLSVLKKYLLFSLKTYWEFHHRAELFDLQAMLEAASGEEQDDE